MSITPSLYTFFFCLFLISFFLLCNTHVYTHIMYWDTQQLELRYFVVV